MNNVLKIGQHPDPIISDVCCYSQPCFDEAAKLFHELNWGKVVALITIHYRSQGMNAYGLANRDKSCDRV